MKLRSSILFGCLLFVPLLAMFSHKIPRGVREGFRDRVWRPAAARVAAWVGGEPDHGGRAVERSAFAPVSPVIDRPAIAAKEPVAAAAPQPPATLPAVAVQSTLVPAPSRDSLDERLEAVGAVGLKVKPPDGPTGLHVASCRVPADASGQLQRLFQASGPTPEVSLERLAMQIEAWRSRVASADGPASTRDAATAAGRRR